MQEWGIPLMAYSPIEQGILAREMALESVAKRHDTTPAQVALAWVISHAGVLAIPKASTEEHVRENAAAAEIQLTHTDLAELDAALPRPAGNSPIEMI